MVQIFHVERTCVSLYYRTKPQHHSTKQHNAATNKTTQNTKKHHTGTHNTTKNYKSPNTQHHTRPPMKLSTTVILLEVMEPVLLVQMDVMEGNTSHVFKLFTMMFSFNMHCMTGRVRCGAVAQLGGGVG